MHASTVLHGRHILHVIYALLVDIYHTIHQLENVTLGDDQQALIWDIQSMPRPIEDPILAYQAGGEVLFQVYLNNIVIRWEFLTETAEYYPSISNCV